MRPRQEQEEAEMENQVKRGEDNDGFEVKLKGVERE